MWWELQDIIGHASKWPHSIKANFSRPLNHWQHVQTAAFVWINGLNPEVFFERCFLVGTMKPNSESHRHFIYLSQYFEEGRPYRLWSWNVTMGRHEWLDGTPRTYEQQN
jgi:arginine exporter protein ArgO